MNQRLFDTARSEAPPAVGAVGFSRIVFRADGIRSPRCDLCCALLEQRRVFMRRLFKQPWRARPRLDATPCGHQSGVCEPGSYARRLLSLGRARPASCCTLVSLHVVSGQHCPGPAAARGPAANPPGRECGGRQQADRRTLQRQSERSAPPYMHTV